MRFAILILWLCHFLPFRVLGWLGNGLGYLLYWLASPRRFVGLTNLRLCFPNWSEAKRRRLIRRHFQLLTTSILERSYIFWSKPSRIKKIIQIEGWEHIQAAENQAVILFAPHFVGLDMGGVRLNAENYPIASIYSKQKSSLLDKYLLHGRTRFGATFLLSRQDSIRKILSAFKQGFAFYYLPDQDFGAKDALFIPFFGVPAATINSMARMTQLAKAQLIPCITRRLPNGKGYVVRLYPAWENYPSQDIHADTRRMNAFIEERVLEMPEQYFWLHKRFKTRPNGEARFYPE